MPHQNMKVRIHTYPFFDNVQLHLPGAEVTLKDAAAFTETCMHWVEKPAIEPAPGIAVPRVQASISEGVLPTPAEPSRLGGGSSAKAAAPVKRRYAKRKVGKRPKIHKATVLAPVLVEVLAAEEATTLIAEPAVLVTAPEAADVPALIAAPPEEGATPPSEPPPPSEPTPPSQPTPPSHREADVSAGTGTGGAEQGTSATANIT